MSDRDAEASVSDHAYFQALEAAFIRLRGAPLLLSPADWQVAKAWRREGIPLELVVRVMERIFERQVGGREKQGIKSLRYFKTAVRRSWQRVLELGGGERTPADGESLDVAALLDRLGRALPDEAAIGDAVAQVSVPLDSVVEVVAHVRERLEGLTGSVPEVEAQLQRLDREMMDRILERLGTEHSAAAFRRAELSLGSLDDRLSPEDRERTLELLVRRQLRQQCKLPVLSLFSPAAAAPDRG